MTVIVDDAGSGDLLFGIVIGAYRPETTEFKYDIIDVKFFQPGIYCNKSYLTEASRITMQLLTSLKAKPDEEVHLCQGYIFDEAAVELKKTRDEKLVQRIRVIGEAQRLTEIAYLDEIRNLGYEPLAEREEKRAKSFFDMMRWLRSKPEMLAYAKTGWPRLKRYRLFKTLQEGEGEGDEEEVTSLHEAKCSECGAECEVPFKPDPHRPVYCKACWSKRRREQRGRGEVGSHSKPKPDVQSADSSSVVPEL